MKERSCTVKEWTDAPQMDIGAPSPALRASAHGLLVAYLLSEDVLPVTASQYAIIRFTGVIQDTFGEPSDESLHTHPLYQFGLRSYQFSEIFNSPMLARLSDESRRPGAKDRPLPANARHWVVTFHDETLEVIGESAELLGTVPASSAAEALDKFLA